MQHLTGWYHGERLIVCRDGDLAARRAPKREELLAATERDPARIQTAARRSAIHGAGPLPSRWRWVAWLKRRMREHFDLTITDTSFNFARKAEAIEAEAATDGLYIVRTSLGPEVLDDAATVQSCKSLARVERSFRCTKTVDLRVRPVHH